MSRKAPKKLKTKIKNQKEKTKNKVNDKKNTDCKQSNGKHEAADKIYR